MGPAVTTFRPGGSWGTTIVREGAQVPDEKGRRSDDEFVLLVVDADRPRAERLALAARVAGLLSEVCDCGHEGLDAMFHLRPCPVAEVRAAARKLGYDLVLIEREGE